MSAQDQPGQEMVGDLPLIKASRFDALGDDYWEERGFDAWNVGDGLESLQYRLLEGQQEGDVNLVDAQIAYHPLILHHWEAFTAMKQRQGGMKSFQINGIALPSAPFFADKLVPALQGSNDSLIRLDLIGCKLGSSGLACVADFLTDNASLAVLDLSRNKIDNVDDAKFLSLAIWNHPELNCVNLSKCGLGGTKGVLSEVLGGVGNLETLLLDYNGICAEGMALVADFLATNTAITTLSLADNHVDTHLKALFTARERLAQKASDEGAQRSWDKDDGIDNALDLRKALKKNTSLRQLDLRHCSGLDLPSFVTSRRATELFTYLDLSDNKIGTKGATMIADYLKWNPALIELDLSCNRMNSEAAEVLANALKSNDTLQELILDDNNFDDKSVPFFVDLLRNNSTLVLLCLLDNSIRIKTGARKDLIRKALCDTSSLEAIVDSNHTCELVLSSTGAGGDTHELPLCNINLFEDELEARKIRYKVVLALFAMETDLFNPRNFDCVPLELMPRLLHLVQQEIGYNGFGEGVVEKTRKRRKNGFNPTLRRLYEVVYGWNQLPLLFVRGPGKLKKKKRKRKDDEEWTPRLAAAASRELKGLG